METNKDYYDILGVAKNANMDQIKYAYKTLAKKWHPDKHNNKERAQKNFINISEAYQILSDPNKKKQYDKSLMYGDIYYNDGFMNPFDLFKHMERNISIFEQPMHSSLFNINPFDNHFTHNLFPANKANKISHSSSSSTSSSYISTNGHYSSKTVKTVTKNGQTYKEIIEDKNGKKTITKIYPNGTKNVTETDKIKELK